ncbi:hypothetical protein H2203_000128 [Taxawa tesnikishii (nom. ined.)]|nr:hypothetical protein H2203_000128 [Dothideales sp. JES 119]
MAINGTQNKPAPRLFSLKDIPSLSSLEALVTQTASKAHYPLALEIQKNVPIYDCQNIDFKNEASLSALQDEWHQVLLHGPGVLALKHLYTDLAPIDAANRAFASIIDNANARIWNSFSKHCLQDPDSFVQYYSNPILALICEAYLGPAYRITTQTNIVKPQGQPQTCHRDYHLGFQTNEAAVQWPRAMHLASQLLTLQGAVAHTDMPLASGPTRLLPYSQLLPDGFLAYRDPAHADFFLEHWVALPLSKGDGLFFNPALFHAAGANQTTDFDRSANLIQVSSAFGKPMESVDAVPLLEKCWPYLKGKYTKEGMSMQVEACVRAVAEGYPFPTNLDKRPPAPGGMAPERAATGVQSARGWVGGGEGNAGDEADEAGFGGVGRWRRLELNGGLGLRR